MSELQELYEEVQKCTRCDLYKGATRGVPGNGPDTADIMFIGEAPGYHEDRQGIPFAGAAGKFLDELLSSINLRRADVYITNVVKHRPPQNRDPKPEEIEACRPYLDRQIELINPKLIITLGRISMERYWPGQSISRIHGQPKRVGGRLCLPMFHPAAALHQPKYRSMIEEDFRKLPELIAQVDGRRGAERGPSDDAPEQLSLF